uniref:phage tail tape measure protein n=1 Tax=Nocardia suismassiliense TaxID=2077092 RepID=UPI003F49A8A5
MERGAVTNAIELVSAYVVIIPDTSRVAPILNRDMQRAGAQSGQSAGRSMGSSLGDSLSGLGGKGGVLGAALAGAAAIAGISAGAIIAKSIASGIKAEKPLDLAQARLGVDEATMRKIGAAAGNAYAQDFGSSVADNIDTARRAIQSGLLDPSATAQDTKKVISQLSGVSELMGEEIPAVSRAAGQAIRTGIAGSAEEAFDLFAAAQRSGLNVSEDFLDTVSEYSTQFRKLGLSGPEAIGLINQAVKGGARDVDIAADAIKEFSIRVVDGSKSTVEAFQGLGFNADDLAARFAAGGATARAATGELLAEIRKIEDPVKRNEVALALFGTQFEDLGDALNAFNLDTAADSLGKVAGAAREALGTMGDNAAHSIESAQRSIEISTDAISGALARAFGPELAKLADWVSTHQPEILGFLGKIADFAFVSADAFLAFSSVSLRALADFAESAGPLLAHVLDPVGKLAEIFGKLSGNSDLSDLGRSVQDLDTKLSGVAERARDLADGIDTKARPGLDRMRESVQANIEATQAAQEVFRALGQDVTALPDGHTITLTDNTPEVTARLEALGLKVIQIPNSKEVRVTANTADGQARLDAFIATNSGRPLTVTLDYRDSNGNAVSGPGGGSDNHFVLPGRSGGGHYATGGLLRGAGTGTSDSMLIAASTGEYVVNAAATARTLPLLEAINAGWIPTAEQLHTMIPGFATGGQVPGKKLAQSLDSATYLMGGFNRSQLDCSGLVSAVVNDALGNEAFSSRMSTATEGDWLAAKGASPGPGGPGDLTVGWFDHGGGPASGHTALTLSDGTRVESNSAEGVVVGGPVGGDHPMFDRKMHFPAALLRGGDLGGGSTGPGAGADGGGLGAGGGTQGGGAIAGATPVFVTNWPGGTEIPNVTGGPAATPLALDTGETPASETPTSPASPPVQGMPRTGDLFSGPAPWYLAATPEAALATLGTQAADLSASTGKGFVDFFASNWTEMLGTGAAVLGMGAVGTGGGGSTYNFNGMDPNSAAAAVERIQRRRTLAMQRTGGFGR